jgi:dTDP-glucose 4,6-dehydratase
MKLLVTGVAGFIGVNFCQYYLSKHPDDSILGVDKLTYAGNNIETFKKDKRCQFVIGDLSNRRFVNSLFKNYEFDSVVHFAAESHVDRSINDASIFIDSNIYGTFNLIDCIKERVVNNGLHGDFKYIQISTDEVYGSVENGNKFTELTPLQPNNPYSASKASADLLVSSYCNTYNFPGIISRCSNNYGPYQHNEKFIPTVILNALQHKHIPIYGDGNQIRDWIYVQDHCSAIDCILNYGEFGEVYNIGGNNEWSNIDIATLLIYYLSDIDDTISIDLLHHVPDRLGHDRRYSMDITKIRKQLGWNPMVKFTDGLKLTIDWYADNV